MSLPELLLSDGLCYVLGIVSGAVLIPWLVDRGLFPVRRHARVSDERRPSDDYRWARQVSALLLIAVVVVIVLLDALVDDYDLKASVLVPLLLTAAGLLSVDLPRLKG